MVGLLSILLGAFLPVHVAASTTPPIAIDCSAMSSASFIGPLPLECGRIRAGTHGGQCVEFIQRLLGTFYTFPAFRGIARDIRPSTTTPAIGEAVLLRDGPLGHAALIYAIDGDELVLLESNLNGTSELISWGRRMPINSPTIRGYFAF